jgi:hypothetical protein
MMLLSSVSISSPSSELANVDEVDTVGPVRVVKLVIRKRLLDFHSFLQD